MVSTRQYCIALIGIFFNFVNATDQSELPVFSYDYQSLSKPNNMGGMTWLRTLEVERNKADYLGNSKAFKAFTKEISQTISGKYGLSKRSATPEEAAKLTRLIISTRRAFKEEPDLLRDFYTET